MLIKLAFPQKLFAKVEEFGIQKRTLVSVLQANGITESSVKIYPLANPNNYIIHIRTNAYVEKVLYG